jgi:hypothetical protein
MEIKIRCMVLSFTTPEIEFTSHQVEKWAVFGAGVDMTAKTVWCSLITYRGADKSLARPGRKRATATEDFEFHISYL